MSAAKLNYTWNPEELFLLVRAWNEVVEPPRDKRVLLPAERAALHARFSSLAGTSRRSVSSVARQHHRLVTAYRLILEFNAESKQKGKPGWFQLPAAQQHELRRVHGKKEGMTAISEELFRELAYVCRGQSDLAKSSTASGVSKSTPSPTVAPSVAPKPSRKAAKAAALSVSAAAAAAAAGDDVEESPRYKWGQRDWQLFVDAWGEAVDEFVDYGNDQREKVKLPNWLIRQRFIALGGSEETTVGSITAKKRCVLQSFHFVRDCVAALQADNGPDWFKMSYNERFRMQRKIIGPKSSQRLGCEINLPMFTKITSIVEKEELLSTVTSSGKRKRKRERKPSVSSLSSASSVFLRSESPAPPAPPAQSAQPEEESEAEEEQDEEEQSEAEKLPASVNSSARAQGDDSAYQVDEKLVEALLGAQNARFELLMQELRDERAEERKQNQAMLLEILHQRAPAEDPQSSNYMESLVGKQQEQLMDLFAQMRKERQQEREDYHALLRQLSAHPSL